MSAEEQKIYITKEGLEKIKTDIDQLVNVERKNIAHRIQEAKELGDLSENAEYAAAKEDQVFLEMKIAELNHCVKNAVIIEENNSSHTGMIGVGSTVIFKDTVGNKKEYQIVGSQEADPLQGKISNESPIGRAFLGKRAGDMVEFQAPKGIVKFEIINIK